ncbi:MAG TPA: DUF58 domain-containing protein [Solirubrobacteraceae bacterium]|nr:DUF58 domain-containing protein [Solirubrobacteraceae bacterium]
MSRGQLISPPGRQGPGKVPGGALARIDIAMKRRVAGLLPGEHRAPGIGVGTELAQLRPYESGDDARRLDPAASARTGTLHVRQHVPERALTTWVVCDVSASMAFGTALRLKSDIGEGVGDVISALAIRRGGRVGLVRCGGSQLLVLPPRGGRGAHARVRAALAEGVAPDGAADAGASLAGALTRVVRLATQPSLVVIVSDFRDPSGWGRPLRALGARHELIAVEVADPREGALPDVGELVVVDPETGELVEAHSSDPALRAAFDAAERTRRAELATALRRAAAMQITLRTDEDWLRALAGSVR